MLVTSIIEYITGYLLEKLFATKWWDYSTYRFNIHGRVCLRNSLMFGVLSVVAARVVDRWCGEPSFRCPSGHRSA